MGVISGNYLLQALGPSCSNLTTVNIGNNVKRIPDLAFAYCSGLETVNLPASLEYIGPYAFSKTKIHGNIVIGSNVRTIGEDAFWDCDSLTSVTLQGPLTTLSSWLFNDCERLSSLIIPGSVTSVGNYVVRECRCLTSVTVNGNTLTVSPNDTAKGKTYIDIPQSNAWDHTVFAVAYGIAEHCHFDHWSDSCLTLIDTLAINSNRNLTAFFAFDRHTLTVEFNDATLGTVSFPSGQTADYSDTMMVIASPITGYCVASWAGDNIVAISTRRDTAWVRILQDDTITCSFVIDTFTVSVSTNNIARGTATATGTQFIYGTPCTVVATAYTGYRFHSWSNGVTANPYTFAVLGNVELTAIFLAPGEDTYTVTVSVNDPTMGTATVNGGSTVTVMSGETVTLAAMPNSGYRFVQWQDGNTDNPRTVTVTGDITYVATFAQNAPVTYTLTVTSNNPAWGTVTGDATYTASFVSDTSAPETYTITVLSANPQMGTVTGSGTYEYGSSSIIAAAANEGYHFTQWQDGNTDNPRTITVTATATYIASFAEDGPNGIAEVTADGLSLAPNPATTTVTLRGVEAGSTVTLVDVNGRVNGVWKAEGNELTIDVSDKAKGVYFVRTVIGAASATHKLIVK